MDSTQKQQASLDCQFQQGDERCNTNVEQLVRNALGFNPLGKDHQPTLEQQALDAICTLVCRELATRRNTIISLESTVRYRTDALNKITEYVGELTVAREHAAQLTGERFSALQDILAMFVPEGWDWPSVEDAADYIAALMGTFTPDTSNSHMLGIRDRARKYRDRNTKGDTNGTSDTAAETCNNAG